MKNSKWIFILLLVCFVLYGGMSCKSTKNIGVKGDIVVKIPCSGKDYRSDNHVFRASGMGFSNDMSIAKNKALQVARGELATSISSLIERVIDNYASSYQQGQEEEAKGKFQDLIRTKVNQQLNGNTIVCEEMMLTKENAYRCYVCVELNGADIVSKINNAVKKEDKLRIDFEYEKFKKIFDEEMTKLQ